MNTVFRLLSSPISAINRFLGKRSSLSTIFDCFIIRKSESRDFLQLKWQKFAFSFSFSFLNWHSPQEAASFSAIPSRQKKQPSLVSFSNVCSHLPCYLLFFLSLQVSLAEMKRNGYASLVLSFSFFFPLNFFPSFTCFKIFGIPIKYALLKDLINLIITILIYLR